MTTMSEMRTVKLVRRRDGVDAFGRKVGVSGHPIRVWHLVDVAADLEAPESVWVCCGLEFAPGTLVEVSWIESLPHQLCLQRSPWPRQRIEADFLAANAVPGYEDVPAGVRPGLLAILDVAPGLAASIAELDQLVSGRYGWVLDSAGSPSWVYNRSFRGVLVAEKRYPRSHDLGITPLGIEVMKPGTVRIQSCGVLAGCPDHAVRLEEVALDNMTVVRERLTSAENAARVVDLERLCWCLIVGPCSARSMADMTCINGEAASDH